LVKSIVDVGDNGFPILLDVYEHVVDTFKLIAGRVAKQLSILANK